MSNSDVNVRAMMPPPPPVLKHKVTGRKSRLLCPQSPTSDDHSVPEPPMKRKTLAERAGEVQRPPSTTMQNYRPVNPAVKSTIMGAVKPIKLSSSTASRAPSNSSRNTSGSSATSVTTDSARSSSTASSYRPQSAMGHSRAVSYDKGGRSTSAVSYTHLTLPTRG